MIIDDKLKEYDIAIIGSGILGVSLAYVLSSLTDKSIVVIEQEQDVAMHASSRNSGKVHAPFLYNPKEKRLFAKASYLGYYAWKQYTKLKGLPFKDDGVLEVALDDKGIDRLELYLRWGLENGLEEKDIRLLDGSEVNKIEPNVRCLKAIYCKRDASTDYKAIAKELAYDSKANGVRFMFNTKVYSIKEQDYVIINGSIKARFLINASGGKALWLAHSMNLAKDYVDMYFRGEYWLAPKVYDNLTSMSIYSVPRNPEYPFLDPHWLVKIDRCEVGPNAVFVFSPYAYDTLTNISSFFPKIVELLRSNARNILLDKQFIELARSELLSSLSKHVMINRVKAFLPMLDARLFNTKGSSGIRSILVKDARFVNDPIIEFSNCSLHILNYNSPGATGALPFAAFIASLMAREGLLSYNYKHTSSILDIPYMMDEMSSLA